ncbi:hypothetical protein [Flavobacterium sp.]|uniref:hypothetical protein n=1 Tax=Flavobacterium sp. TaxID=239 RepID=UPI003B99122D
MRKALFISLSAILLFLLNGCGAGKSTLVDDYFIAVEGKMVSNKAVNAFIFENRNNELHFRNYMRARFGVTGEDFDVDVNVNGQPIRLLFYSKNDFDRYFEKYNFKYTGLVDDITADQMAANHFVAISAVDAGGNDALDESHIIYQEMIAFLNDFKKQYLRL